MAQPNQLDHYMSQDERRVRITEIEKLLPREPRTLSNGFGLFIRTPEPTPESRILNALLNELRDVDAVYHLKGEMMSNLIQASSMEDFSLALNNPEIKALICSFTGVNPAEVIPVITDIHQQIRNSKAEEEHDRLQKKENMSAAAQDWWNR